ncbi:MAG: GNAT family N-acetyltransferase [Actinoplanes sp.]
MGNFRLEPWDERGLDFERRANTAEMQAYLGGVEPDEAIVARHQRFLETVRTGAGSMFLILVDDEPEPVGSVGYWSKEWRGEVVYELGWKVLTGFQGRGLASGGTAEAVRLAAAEKRHRWAHAYPRTDNTASNGVCRRAGFELLGEVDFEYPKGHPIRCNDWRHRLLA